MHRVFNARPLTGYHEAPGRRENRYMYMQYSPKANMKLPDDEKPLILLLLSLVD